MLAFIVSRLLQFARRHAGGVVPVLRAVQTSVGDPVNNMVGQEATPAERAEMRRDLRVGDSVAVQFARFPRQRRHRQFRQELPAGAPRSPT